jgi:hypothetical protein
MAPPFCSRQLSAELKGEWVRGSAVQSVEGPDGGAADRPAAGDAPSLVSYFSQILSL